MNEDIVIIILLLVCIAILFIFLAIVSFVEYKKLNKLTHETNGKVDGIIKSGLIEETGEGNCHILIKKGSATDESFTYGNSAARVSTKNSMTSIPMGGFLSARNSFYTYSIPPYRPVVSYTVNDKEYYSVVTYGVKKDEYKIGDKVIVKYDEKYPQKCILKDDNSIKNKVIFYLYFALGCTLLIIIAACVNNFI